MAKLKTFRYQGERRLVANADYAESEECLSVFLLRYFGAEQPPRCGTCDRCRAVGATATRAGPSRQSHSEKARRIHDRPTRSRILKFMMRSLPGWSAIDSDLCSTGTRA